MKFHCKEREQNCQPQVAWWGLYTGLIGPYWDGVGTWGTGAGAGIIIIVRPAPVPVFDELVVC